MKHRCLDCKKYHLEPDEGEGLGYICDAEQKQEDSDNYRGKKYYNFFQYASCNPEIENDCPKFISKVKQ